jgi:flagellar biosynthesis/type III secretory pathway protein FliH
MAEMVQKAVQGVRNEPWVRVEVSQEMVRLIDRLSTLYDQSAGVEVSAIPAAAGTVHIETPSGVVDASLRTQLENLREYFTQAPQ